MSNPLLFPTGLLLILLIAVNCMSCFVQDMCSGEVLYDEVLTTLHNCLTGLVQPVSTSISLCKLTCVSTGHDLLPVNFISVYSILRVSSKLHTL